jgi:hypothetical protein
MFHDAVAIHARRLLPSAIAVELVKARSALPSRVAPRLTDHSVVTEAVKAAGGDGLHLTCLYGVDRTRQRICQSLLKLLGLPARSNLFRTNGIETSIGAVTVVFLSPEGALERLSGKADRRDLEQWGVRAIGQPAVNSGGNLIRAAIVETGDAEELRNTEKDPKHVMRRVLASKGIVTQFLSSGTDDESDELGVSRDHPSESAIWDLLRSAGVFPERFPTVEAVPNGTWLVGFYVVKPRNGGKLGRHRQQGTGYVVSAVAVQAGGHQALGFDKTRGWVPVHEFTARFLASPQSEDKLAAKTLIEAAISHLHGRDPHSKLVLFFDAIGSRGLWNGLTDTGGDELPRTINPHRVAVVRVRNDDREAPRAAGVGSWSRLDLGAGPRKPSTSNALYRLKNEQWPGAMYYVSSSATMNRPGQHRGRTRFSCTPAALGKNWHALTMTEFWSPFPGPFSRHSLYELASLLCRQALTWGGTLDRPAPLHLAAAVVSDHPDRYEVRDDEGVAIEGGE